MEFPARNSDKSTEDLRQEVLKLHGQAREDWVIEQVAAGLLPSWMNTTSTVILQKQVPVTVEVAPDYLTLGDDNDWFIMPVNMMTAQRIADMIGAVLPTKKIVDCTFEQAGMKLPAQPWGPPYDASMMSSERFLAQAKKDFERTVDYRRHSPTSLAAGHRKDYVVCPQLDTKHTAIYGWFQLSGQPIQGPGVQYKAHEATYVDYSQAPRFMDFYVMVDGVATAFSECLDDHMLGRIISDVSSTVWRHPAV